AAMGDKIESKKLAKSAGVSTVPGHIGVIKDTDEAVKIAGEIGYPVMIKASAGGGGKGMRVAYSEEEVADGFRSATNEAKSSFADDRVFIEKFVEEPRHIEIQILADTHGNCVYVGERECSIQRRHQKVIEEAPSPFLDEATRKAMGEEAVALSRAVDYRSAGTVEFIVDKDRNFYFLEMNTRLQVEHPVTELVTGLDLVEEMIRVAAGGKLSVGQDDIKLNGWAVESRVYAEDPTRGFLPSIGRLVGYRPPEDLDNVRVDTGVFEGAEISMFYDPMIAKLVTWGTDREAAIETMRRALDAYYIRGVNHNMGFLASLMRHPRFAEGRLTTNFIAEEYPDGFSGVELTDDDTATLVAVAGAMHLQCRARDLSIDGQITGHEPLDGGDWVVQIGNAFHPIRVAGEAGDCEIMIGDTEESPSMPVVTGWVPGEVLFHGLVGVEQLCVQVDQDGPGWRVGYGGVSVRVRVLTKRQAELAALMPVKLPPDTSNFLLSPMPGLLVSLAVGVGQEVKAGEELAVVEAMKMENILRAERDGTVKTVHADAGASLSVDQPIVEFE
ncbi:MAG: biotin/lipoyl-containing protein, partial [Pseudomonadota bacterium]